MNNFKKSTAAIATMFLISACSSSATLGTAVKTDNKDGRYTELLNMSLPEFYGTLAIASTVSNDCSGLSRNPRIDLELNEQRNKQGRGSFAALGQRKAIGNAQSSMTQSFKNSNGSNICAVAERDFAQASKPYTFFLGRSE